MAAITRSESTINFILWIAAVGFAIYQTFKVGKEYFTTNFEDTYNDFTFGWQFLDRNKDDADVEWKYGLNLLLELLPWYLVHCIVAELLRQLDKKQYLTTWYTTIGLSFSIYHLGAKSSFYFVTQPILGYFFLKFKRKSAIWFANLLSLIIINYYEWFNIDLSELSHYKIHITIATIAWINLRSLNYFLDAVSDSSLHKINIDNLFDLFGYCFYLPVLFYGPLILFSDFKSGLDKPDTRNLIRKLNDLGLKLFRFTFWLVFTEFMLHFVYVNALSYQIQAVEEMNLWALYGLGYCMGQFFHIKYVVFYGLSTSLAQFEGIATPDTPKCIGRIHLYSDMWKYFDRGLYFFLLRYIYIPLSGRKKTIMSKLFASFICFLYIYLWHGIQYFIAIWSILNFLGITIETFCAGVAQSAFYEKFIAHNLSAQGQRRLGCVLATPLFAMSALSNFYFFAGKDVGDVFVSRFLQGPATYTICILTVLYFGSQVSVEIKDWHLQKKEIK